MRIAKGFAAVLATALLAGTAHAAPPLEEEQFHPSEIVFEGGKPYAQVDGQMQPVKTRTEHGQTIYYRMVRFDVEEGYLGGDGAPVANTVFAQGASAPSTPYRWDGSGRPDFYNSPYNRDARQRYFGPGYFGSCSRYDGCRGVQLVPVYPIRYRY